MVRGSLFILSAASGTGKTSLAAALVNLLPDIVISVSHTTRVPRQGEMMNESYYFVSMQEFNTLIEQKAFLEYAKVYDDYYGTSKKTVEEALNAGKDVILDIDWQGARAIKQQMDCHTIFLLPPSLSELRSRLEIRKRETGPMLEARMQKALSEIKHYTEFDYLVINQTFEIALKELQSIILANRLKLAKQQEGCKKLVNDLILENSLLRETYG